MKRQRALELVELLLHNLDARIDQWPLDLVTEVYIFGSFARGALEPHDVDIDIEHETPWDWATTSTSMKVRGRDPHSLFRRPLLEGRRGCQILFNHKRWADFEMTLLWARGDELEGALKRLHGIKPDPAAGRAPRDAMIPEFEGLDRWLPLYTRESLIAMVDAGALRVERLTLEDAPMTTPLMEEVRRRRRWDRSSPLFRAAKAVIAYWERRGIDPGTAHLHGKDIRDQDTPYFAGFDCRYLQSMPRCLTTFGGLEWLEVVHPTKTLPLHSLRLVPLDGDGLRD
jgi:hypothetical protein